MYDEETGFYYLRSRYYDPSVGRFINADSIITNVGSSTHGCNMFSYCFDNPVNYIDIHGYSAAEALRNFVNNTWWIPFIDGPLTLADLFYAGVVIVFEITVVIDVAIGINSIDTYITESKPRATVKSKNKTKTLVDVSPVTPNSAVYHFAYIEKHTGVLIITPIVVSFESAKTMTTMSQGIISYMESLTKKGKHPKYGFYTQKKEHAKALALATGCYECPEVHDSGYYGHYHYGEHEMHIWYGNMMFY